ncbi:MAG: transporter [Cardiobacteriaceae bacterium]|nr:transporter [Cardiobacteriaceae bacterium]
MRQKLTRYWPILLLIVIIAFLILNWRHIALPLQRLQNRWNRDISAQLLALRHNSEHIATWLTLCGLGFLYGILHAVGPGHGKAVIATFTLSQPAKQKQTLLIAIGGALAQGISAIIWVALAMGVLRLFTADAIAHSLWLNRANALLIALIGLYLMVRHRPRQQHHAHCTCGHHHSPSRPLTAWPAIIAIGIRPCSGAVLSLAVAWSWGIIAAGIAMTIAMAIGTAITITTIAMLCYHGKQRVARHLIRDNARIAHLAHYLAILGGIILIALAILLWQNSAVISPTAQNPIGLPQ